MQDRVMHYIRNAFAHNGSQRRQGGAAHLLANRRGRPAADRRLPGQGGGPNDYVYI
jgi:hypothetical protein